MNRYTLEQKEAILLQKKLAGSEAPKYRHEWKHEICQLDLLTIRQRLQAVMEPDPHAVEGKYFIRSLYFDNLRDKALREKLDSNSLAHTKWNYKYHIVFTPKYRRQAIYQKISADTGQINRTLCARKGIEIIEAAALKDHIHLYMAIPPKYSVSEIMGYLKGKSSLMIFDRHANLKYKYGSRNFWCRGYYVDTVGRNKKIIAEYIRNQLEEDYAADQTSIKEYFDPFTGDKNQKA